MSRITAQEAIVMSNTDHEMERIKDTIDNCITEQAQCGERLVKIQGIDKWSLDKYEFDKLMAAYLRRGFDVDIVDDTLEITW